MAEPFIGEIRLFSFNFAPTGWAMCNGQTLQVNQNQALFTILGNTYGGDGVNTFQLPNLQGRAVMHRQDGVYPLGSTGGEENHTLTANEIPEHTHEVTAGSDSTLVSPNGNVWGTDPGVLAYTNELNSEKLYMNTDGLDTSGGSAPHNNMQPYTVVNYCIALQGIFPPKP
jgi:microcystin-dependent protein